MVLLESMAGVALQPIHYRGAVPALTDVIAGHIDLMSVSVSLALPAMRGGEVRIFGIGSAQRLAAVPDIATVAESVPGYEASTWFGLFAPAGTPRDIVTKINGEVVRLLADPEFHEKFLAPQMFEPMFEPTASTPEAFAAYIGTQTQKWGTLIRERKLSIDK
jgi:tripartite-type tricarboxylate transporter receptor subunit TctC